jgi:hypothetical protein
MVEKEKKKGGKKSGIIAILITAFIVGGMYLAHRFFGEKGLHLFTVISIICFFGLPIAFAVVLLIILKVNRSRLNRPFFKAGKLANEGRINEAIDILKGIAENEKLKPYARILACLNCYMHLHKDKREDQAVEWIGKAFEIDEAITSANIRQLADGGVEFPEECLSRAGTQTS